MDFDQMTSERLAGRGAARGPDERRVGDTWPAWKSKSKVVSLPVLDALTCEEWKYIRACLQACRPRASSRGRPRRDLRAVLGGVLWVLETGCAWAAMPANFPPYQTCHRSFKKWRDAGVLEQVLTMLYRGRRHGMLTAVEQRRKTRRRSETRDADSPRPALAYA
ncbi:transposase [Burkholderia ubonensis]|uniref:transposase n=1 Tax=Burkholderia ubonensis TaxID=101571 RepID=UPI000A93F7CC|nr:transposase [Burkholderia ubonensis]